MILTGVIAVSSDRSTDGWLKLAGPSLRSAAAECQLPVGAEAVVGPDPAFLARTIKGFASQGCGLILISGGCGIGLEDITPEALRSVARCELPAFGEYLRRSLTPGSAAFSSRALAAMVSETLVVALPGPIEDTIASLKALAPAIHQLTGQFQDPRLQLDNPPV